MTVINPFDFFIEASAEQFPFEYEPWLARELRPFRETEPLGGRLEAYLSSVDRTPQKTIDFLVNLNQRLQGEVRYLIRLEPGVQSCEETLALASGSCRDSAWLMVQILRHLGLAARFVSGYLVQLVPDVKPLDGPAGPPADFTDLHAWAEVYIPGAGWVGLDPTSGLLADEGHIPLACSPDPAAAAPITGAVEECRTEFSFAMTIARIHEDPRVTKPYKDEEWARIKALGRAVDERFCAGDVRLTMGGEPTFVSIDDMDGAEWTVAAVGPNKRRLSEQLVRRLQADFAPQALLHFGQGKWYPGESLPRWALCCYWRPDGQPVWSDPSLIAEDGRQYGHGADDAQRFVRRLAEHLDVDANWTVAAYEDPWHYLAKERHLPLNVDPCDAKSEDAEERARLASVFERGLSEVAGYVLPLERQWWQGKRAVAAAPGRCAVTRCFCCRATRRWACGCRSIRCRTSRPPTGESLPRSIRRRHVAPLPDYPGRIPQPEIPAAARGRDAREVAEQDTLRAASRYRAHGRHSHRAVRGIAVGHVARVPAAGGTPGGLSGPGCLRRGRGRRRRDSRGGRGLFAAGRPPAGALQSNAGPWRDRSEHAAGRKLGRTRAHHHDDL